MGQLWYGGMITFILIFCFPHYAHAEYNPCRIESIIHTNPVLHQGAIGILALRAVIQLHFFSAWQRNHFILRKGRSSGPARKIYSGTKKVLIAFQALLFFVFKMV